MAKANKAAARRGKPSYVMSIIGVTLVLFLLGVVGWLLINGNKLGDYFRENIEVKAYLRGDISSADSTKLMQDLAAKPYMRSLEFVNKEEARNRFLFQEGEVPDSVLGYNPLPHAIYFHVKKEYVIVDSLEKIRTDIRQNTVFTDVQYPKEVVANLQNNIRKISLILLAIAIGIAISVIFLIDNTIRLAMFSNRFLIKTMQMVGATRWFIAKPLTVRAVVNGAFSAVIAIALVYTVIIISQQFLPGMKVLHDDKMLIGLFLVLILIGILITVFSTYRSVLKYQRMKLDELY